MAKPVSAITSFVCVTVEGLESELELDSVPVMESVLVSGFHSASDSAVVLSESVSAADSDRASDSVVALSVSVSAADSEPESDSA